MTRLRVVMDQTPRDHYLEPILIAVLIVLRSNRPELFASLCDGQAGPREVMLYLDSLPGGKNIVASYSGQFIEAFLIASDENENRKAARLAELKTIAENESPSNQSRDAAIELLNLIQHAHRSMHRSPRFRVVARKVDLSAGLKD